MRKIRFEYFSERVGECGTELLLGPEREELPNIANRNPSILQLL
jgi:hypothetical protein